MRFPPFPLFGQPAGPPPPPAYTSSLGGSLRRFTHEQIAPQVAIVGSRIDRAVRDLIARYNGLEPQDMGKRWVICQRVGGYSPQFNSIIQDPSQLPWLNVSNSQDQVGNIDPVQNPYRLKGTFNPDIADPSGDKDGANTQYVWSTTFYTDQPIRILGLNLTMTSDRVHWYMNPWKYGSVPPPSRSAGQPLNDLYLDVSVDDRFYTSTRAKTEPEIRISLSSADIYKPDGDPDQTNVVIDIRNIDVRVPQFSRVRLSVMVPAYDTTYVSGWNTDLLGGSTHAPYANQSYSWTITTAEAMQA